MKKYSIIAIILLAVIGFHVWLYNRKPEPQANLEKVRAEAKTEIDSLYGEIRVRDLRIAKGTIERDSLQTVNKVLEAQLETIKKDKDEKITMAGTYTVGDQQRFFTERYGK